MENNMKNELELGFVSRVYSDKDCTLNRTRIPNTTLKSSPSLLLPIP